MLKMSHKFLDLDDVYELNRFGRSAGRQFSDNNYAPIKTSLNHSSRIRDHTYRQLGRGGRDIVSHLLGALEFFESML